MKHFDDLKNQLGMVRTLADVFAFLRRLQSIDIVWGQLSDYLAEQSASASEEAHLLLEEVRNDIQALRAELSAMEEKVKGYGVQNPSSALTASLSGGVTLPRASAPALAQPPAEPHKAPEPPSKK